MIVKKAVAQECGIVCIVAYSGPGLTGGELVWARNVLLLSWVLGYHHKDLDKEHVFSIGVGRQIKKNMWTRTLLPIPNDLINPTKDLKRLEFHFPDSVIAFEDYVLL